MEHLFAEYFSLQRVQRNQSQRWEKENRCKWTWSIIMWQVFTGSVNFWGNDTEWQCYVYSLLDCPWKCHEWCKRKQMATYVCCQVIMPWILWTYAPGMLANCWISYNESHWTFKTRKLQPHMWKGLQEYKTEANHSLGLIWPPIQMRIKKRTHKNRSPTNQNDFTTHPQLLQWICCNFQTLCRTFKRQ